MKKVIIAMLFGLICLTGTAQVYMGGSLSVNRTSTWDEWKGSVSVSPEIGYRFSEKWMGGIRLHTEWLDGESSTVTRSISASPYAQYQLVGYGKWGLWAHGEMTFRSSVSETDGSRQNVSSYFGIHCFPTVTYRLGDHFLLTSDLSFATLGYDRYQLKDHPVSQGVSIGFRPAQAAYLQELAIGFVYLF